MVREVSDGKLAAKLTAEVETLGALFVTDTGKISEASVAEGTGDKAEGARGKAEGALGKVEGAGGKAEGAGGKAEGAAGKEDGAGGKADGAGGKAEGAEGNEAEVTLEILVLTGSKDDGNSGKLEDTVGKGLKLGYCIGCCIDEGIDKPGGG